jgi:hypothetical protein
MERVEEEETMKHSVRWGIGIVLIVITLGLAACGNKSGVLGKIEPSRLEPIEGSDLQRVVLTEKAAQRIDIQTVLVVEEQVVRKRAIGGEVVAVPEAEAGNPGPVWARVSLAKEDLNQVDWDQPIRVLALDRDDEEDQGWPAEPDEGPLDDDPEDVDLPGEDLAEELYYLITSPEHGLAVGQAVLVELTLSAQDALHRVVPYAAVLYGVHGETWVYSNPEPLVFVRQPIMIDYIEGDRAYLSEGPEVGTAVVTVGAAELFGTETGVSK